MSRPVAAMNARNSSTVTALVEMANGRSIDTQCTGFSNDAEILPARSDPCLNRPLGTTVRAGHAGQSRMTVPDFGSAADPAGTFSDSGAWCTMIHATTASTAIAAPTPTSRATAPAVRRPRDPNRGNSGNCAARLDSGAAIDMVGAAIDAVGAAIDTVCAASNGGASNAEIAGAGRYSRCGRSSATVIS